MKRKEVRKGKGKGKSKKTKVAFLFFPSSFLSFYFSFSLFPLSLPVNRQEESEVKNSTNTPLRADLDTESTVRSGVLGEHESRLLQFVLRLGESKPFQETSFSFSLSLSLFSFFFSFYSKKKERRNSENAILCSSKAARIGFLARITQRRCSWRSVRELAVDELAGVLACLPACLSACQFAGSSGLRSAGRTWTREGDLSTGGMLW